MQKYCVTNIKKFIDLEAMYLLNNFDEIPLEVLRIILAFENPINIFIASNALECNNEFPYCSFVLRLSNDTHIHIHYGEIYFQIVIFSNISIKDFSREFYQFKYKQNGDIYNFYNDCKVFKDLKIIELPLLTLGFNIISTSCSTHEVLESKLKYQDELKKHESKSILSS